MEIPHGSFRLTEYLSELQLAIEIEHDCNATPLVTMPVAVTVGEQGWRGMVAAFELQGHFFASRCYAWPINFHGKVSFVTQLKMPPVFSAEDAVRNWLGCALGSEARTLRIAPRGTAAALFARRF